MTVHQQVASTVIALIFFAIIFYLLRKRILGEVYALIWMGCALSMLGVIWFYPVLVFITYLMGAVLPTTTLFILGFIFVLLLCLKFSITLSRHKNQIKELSQRLALMEKRHDR